MLKTLRTNKSTRYLCGDLINSGSFGKIYRCVDLKNRDIPLALKEISKNRKNECPKSTQQKINNEIQALKMLSNCENVAQYIDSYEDDNTVKIVMEYCRGGDLNSYVEKNGTLTEPQLALVALQVLKILQRCHEYGIVFADVKPANLCLVDPYPNPLSVKIVDFGCIRHEVGLSLVGSPAFMSPEVFSRNFSYKADIWSLGITLYWLYTMRFPYSCKDLEVIDIEGLSNVIKNSNFRLDRLHSLSPLGYDFIVSCLTKRECDRPHVDEAINHPWIKSAILY